jgi:tetratricopeptide (TPR) repeat protein
VEAERQAEKAYAAYQQKDYTGAIELYEKAYGAAPSADALFNIARVYDLGLRDRSRAIEFYRRYVSDSDASAERIRQVNQRLTQLEEAELAETEKRPPTPTAVDSSPPDGASARAAPVSADPERDGGLAWSSWKVAALTVGASGVVALGVGAGYGAALVGKAKRANRECDGNACASQTGVDAARAAARDARVANWALGIGGSLVASAALLWLLEPEPPNRSQRGSLRLTPIAGSYELGAALTGRW